MKNTMSKETVARINYANKLAEFFEECARISRKEGNIKVALFQEERAKEHRHNAMRYAAGEDY